MPPVSEALRSVAEMKGDHMTVKIGLVGTGTVGCGCLEVLKNHRDDFKRHFGVTPLEYRRQHHLEQG